VSLVTGQIYPDTHTASQTRTTFRTPSRAPSCCRHVLWRFISATFAPAFGRPFGMQVTFMGLVTECTSCFAGRPFRCLRLSTSSFSVIFCSLGTWKTRKGKGNHAVPLIWGRRQHTHACLSVKEGDFSAGVVVHACNPSAWEAEAGGSGV
jgi:hypothetical protein